MPRTRVGLQRRPPGTREARYPGLMRRWHLFEIEDQPWCPVVLRDAATAYLTTMTRFWGLFDAAGPLVERLLEHTEDRRIVDLCSGAGGPGKALVDHFEAQGAPVRVHCTDLFPNQEALAHVAAESGGQLTFSAEPIDATAVPTELRGVRTLFNAFHHLRPAQARGVLEDAVRSGHPIAVFEFVDRQPHVLAGLPGLPFAVLAALPFCRPFRWAWVPWTYVVPLLPLLVTWDGFVSCMRVYSPPELEELVAGLDTYDWEIGRIPLPYGVGVGTYLLGAPR